jgi:integrase
MEIEEYETVQRWLNAVQSDHSGSQHTTQHYLRWFKKFVTWTVKTPDELIIQRKEELKSDDTAVKMKAEETLRSFCNWLEREKDYKRATVRAHHACIKSFYRYNYVPLMLKAPKKSASFGVGAHTKEEIKKLYDVANLRDRAVILCLAETGMSRADFCRLTYGDVREDYEKNLDTIHLKVIRRKAEVVYDTFIGKSGTTALRNYLEARKRKGETLKAETPLFPSKKGGNRFETANSLTLLVRRLGEITGIKTSPHRFRKFFESSLGAQVPSLMVRHWMGHSLGVESSYLLTSIEKQREAYENGYEAIDVLGVTNKVDKEKLDMRLQILALQMEGKTEDEKKAILVEFMGKLSPPTKEALVAHIQDEPEFLGFPMSEVLKAIEKATTPPTHKKTHATEKEDCSRIVTEEELPEYLKKHWHVVCTLPSGKIVVSND